MSLHVNRSETMQKLILGRHSEEDDGKAINIPDEKSHRLDAASKGFRGPDAAGEVSQLEAFVKKGTRSSPTSPKATGGERHMHSPVRGSAHEQAPLSRQSKSAQGAFEAAPPGQGHDGSWRDMYLAHFSGLDSYGATGMTRLEELIDAAFQSCDVARKLCPTMRSYRGAALLTTQGSVFTGSSLESATSALLSVSAEKGAILKAVSEGENTYILILSCYLSHAGTRADGCVMVWSRQG